MVSPGKHYHSAGEGGPRTVWRLPNYQHLLRMLKNPTYAGAFAYGTRKMGLSESLNALAQI